MPRLPLTLHLLVALALLSGAPVQFHASTWNQLALAPTSTPPARFYPSMAYDPVSKKIVLFGGFSDNGNLNDTWTYDGTGWTQVATPVAPPARNGAGMAYDRATRKLVLFGGFNTNKYLHDTWVWDGVTSTWTQAVMEKSPPHATGASLFSDPLTGGAMMFGGYNSNRRVPAFSITWRWTGTSWKQLHPHTVPIPRGWGTATRDLLRHNVVLTGGNGDTIRTDNTWTWDGVDWTWVFPNNQVPRFIGGGSAFDPAARAVVLFGGFNDDGSGETWSWSDGTDWTQWSPASSPSAREGVGMAYDRATHQVILFGGLTADGFLMNDTWQLVGH
jgi:N-acetylneuraminic acid mutarotase